MGCVPELKVIDWFAHYYLLQAIDSCGIIIVHWVRYTHFRLYLWSNSLSVNLLLQLNIADEGVLIAVF